MRLLTRTSRHSRNCLYLTRDGIFATYERRGVDKPWVVSESICIPWRKERL